MSNEKESNNDDSISMTDATDVAVEKEGPTFSELSKDVDTVLERWEKMVNDDDNGDGMVRNSKMTSIIQNFKQLSKLIHESKGDIDMLPPAGLVNFIKESISMFEESDTCGPSGSEGEKEFFGKIAAKIATINDTGSCRNHNNDQIQEGNVAMIHSLQSTTGKRLNGSRVLILKYHPDQERWEVRVEFEKGTNHATKALKEANLTRLRRAPLPTGTHRGFANMQGDLENVPSKLCELLLYHKGNFTPSDIVFSGYGSFMFQRMGEMNFMFFVATQIEQIGGVLGLGNFCQQAGEEGTEAVVLALLKGDEMYVDVLIQTMHWTGEIIKSDWDSDYSGRDGFRNCPPTELTPDQDSVPYIRTMKEGPVLLLECVAKYCFAPALWAALSRSEFYHLLVQRLLRWTAREVKKTTDGTALGASVRKVLSRMFPDVADSLRQPISEEAAEIILIESGKVLCDVASVTVRNLTSLLGQA